LYSLYKRYPLNTPCPPSPLCICVCVCVRQIAMKG